MALPDLPDILAVFPGWSTAFELAYRQEQSRTQGGVTYVKDFGNPLWSASYQSKTLSPNELDEWRARLDALENGPRTFKGYPLSRVYPIAYPNGAGPTGSSFDGISAAVSAVGADNKSLQIDGLPATFALSVGDLLQIQHGSDPVRYDLYRMQEAATADGTGETGAFQVRPHLWPGVAVDSVVAVKRPWCLMQIVPGSISSPADPQTGRGSISFQGIEARDI
jgi:hypothetical protein